MFGRKSNEKKTEVDKFCLCGMSTKSCTSPINPNGLCNTAVEEGTCKGRKCKQFYMDMDAQFAGRP